MISVSDVSLQYGGRVLFKDVNISFSKGNCYGLIGANGTGKSTFLKILSGELEPNTGNVFVTPGERMSVLKQDHFAFDSFTVVDTVLYGNKRLFDVRKEKDAIYAKEDFSDADGLKASELEAEFAEMDGWNAESDAQKLLNGLGITGEWQEKQMSELGANQKVKVLLAQALFATRISCCWTNPPTIWISNPSAGWKTSCWILKT